jgi:hypothetical protein
MAQASCRIETKHELALWMLIFSKSDIFTCSCPSVGIYVMFQVSKINSTSQKYKLSHGINYLLRFRGNTLTKGDVVV